MRFSRQPATHAGSGSGSWTGPPSALRRRAARSPAKSSGDRPPAPDAAQASELFSDHLLQHLPVLAQIGHQTLQALILLLQLLQDAASPTASERHTSCACGSRSAGRSQPSGTPPRRPSPSSAWRRMNAICCSLIFDRFTTRSPVGHRKSNRGISRYPWPRFLEAGHRLSSPKIILRRADWTPTSLATC